MGDKVVRVMKDTVPILNLPAPLPLVSIGLIKKPRLPFGLCIGPVF